MFSKVKTMFGKMSSMYEYIQKGENYVRHTVKHVSTFMYRHLLSVFNKVKACSVRLKRVQLG